jgi:hypothetical protein
MTTRTRRAALLATAGLIGLGTALAGPASAATAPAAKTVQLDGVPQVAALAGDHLWVLVFRSGSPALVEIDPSTTRPTGRSVALPPDVREGGVGSPSSIRSSLAVAEGDLFVPAADGLLQIDPEGAEIVRRLPFPSRYVAAGDAGLWAIGEHPTPTNRYDGSPGYSWTLAHVDPMAGTIGRTIVLGPSFTSDFGPVELAVGDSDLWLSTPTSVRSLLRVDVATGNWEAVPGGAWLLTDHDGALYSVGRGGGTLTVRHGDEHHDVGVLALTDRAIWRDLAVGPDGTAWGVTFRGEGRPGFLVRQPLSEAGARTPIPLDPVGVTVGTSAAWVLSASDRTLTRVPIAVFTPRRDPIRLTAAQLRINQRISQAAVRRLNALTAMADALPAPEPEAGRRPGRLRLSAEQLLINQRISQAAVRRANTLTRRLQGIIPRKTRPSPQGDAVAVSARQLLISQRIAQAAVRRANVLAERIPRLFMPSPGPNEPYMDDVTGTLGTTNLGVMTITEVRRSGPFGDQTPFKVGDRMPVVFPHPQPSFGAGSTISAIGIVYGGVMYGRYVSIEPAPSDR